MIGIVIAVLVIGTLGYALFGPHKNGRRRRGTNHDGSNGWGVPVAGDVDRDRHDGGHDAGADAGADGSADGGGGSDGGGGGGSDGGGGGCGGGGCGGGGS